MAQGGEKEVVVARLDPAIHDRASFESANEKYTAYLREQAGKHGKQNYSKTYVAVREGEARILGYASLSMGQFEREQFDVEIVKRLPPYAMPVLLLGKLATDKEFERRGLGKLLLRWAMNETLEVSKRVGCHGLGLEAENEGLVHYYHQSGFIRISRASRLMYLPTATIEKATAQLAGA